MNTSLDGNFNDIFLLSLPRRTEDRIFTQLTNTAASKSLNHAHLFAMLSVCCFDMASDQLGTSFKSFWYMMSTFRPLDIVYDSSYNLSNVSIITGHIKWHNCPMYSRFASVSTLKLSIYDRVKFFY